MHSILALPDHLVAYSQFVVLEATLETSNDRISSLQSQNVLQDAIIVAKVAQVDGLVGILQMAEDETSLLAATIG